MFKMETATKNNQLDWSYDEIFAGLDLHDSFLSELYHTINKAKRTNQIIIIPCYGMTKRYQQVRFRVHPSGYIRIAYFNVRSGAVRFMDKDNKLITEVKQ